MRIVFEQMKPEFKVTVFSWNQKFLVKLEQPGLEQTYKIAEMDVAGEASVRKLLENEEFLAAAAAQFRAMRATLGNALSKLGR